jgi:hypothetical protein
MNPCRGSRSLPAGSPFLFAAMLLSCVCSARAAVPACTDIGEPTSNPSVLNAVAANPVSRALMTVGYQVAPDGTEQALAALRSHGTWRLTPLPPTGSQSILQAVQWIDATHALAAGVFLVPNTGTSCQQDSDCVPLPNFQSGICSPAGVCQVKADWVLSWDGASWSTVDSGHRAPPAWESYWGYSPTAAIGVVDPLHLWVGSGLERYTSNGPAGPWTTQEAGIPQDGGTDCIEYPEAAASCGFEYAPYAFAVHSGNDIWGSGEGLIHWDGSRWGLTPLPSPDPNAPGCGMVVFNLATGNGSVFIVNNGSGYTSQADALFSPPPHGRRAKGKALMGVNTVTVTNGGSGYTSPPNAIFDTPAGGFPAGPATVTIANGAVTSVTVITNNAGIGYTSIPNVTFSGGGGTGAAAVVNDLNVEGVAMTDGGSGYPGRIDTWGKVTFSGGGGSGATGRVSGNCFQQGTIGISAALVGGGFVDYSSGYYEQLAPDGNVDYFSFLLDDSGGSWHQSAAQPQVTNPVETWEIAFNGPNDGWLGGQLLDSNLNPVRAYLEHFDGTRWSEVGGTLPAGGFIYGLAPIGSGVAAVGATTANQPFVLECR